MSEDRGLRPIGSLLPKIESSPGARDWTTGSSGTPSGTTGTQLPALKRPSGTGLRPGGTGAATKPEWTPNADPEQVNADLWASVKQRLPSSVATSERAVYEPEFALIETIEVRGELTAADRDGLYQLERELVAFCEPTPRATTVKVIQALRQRTAGRTPDEGDAVLMLDEYARAFTEYPEDVIREACRRWSRSNRWFPAEADLRETCERLYGPRKRLAEGLRRAHRAGPVAEKSQSEPPPKRYRDLTPEEQAAHDELIRHCKAQLAGMGAEPMPASAKSLAYDLAKKAAGHGV